MVLVHDNDLAEPHGIYDGAPIESLQPDAMLSHLRSAELKIHEIPFGLDLLSADNGGNADTETVWVATLSNLFEERSPSASPSSPSRYHVKVPLPQIEHSLLHMPLKGGRTLFQSSESGDDSGTSMSHAHPTTAKIREPIDIALKEYEERTGIHLLEYHLTTELEGCDSAYSVTEILQAQVQESQRLRDHGGKLMTWVKPVVYLLYALSTSGALGEDVSVPLSPTIAIFAGIGMLLDATKHVDASNDALVDLFESMEKLLRPLDVCTKIPPTTATTTILMKILIELLSILALGAQQVEQGLLLAQYDTVELGSKLFGIKSAEVVRQRLDRLNQEEARATVVQTLEVVYGLLRNMKAVMNGGESSISELREALVTMQLVTRNMNKAKRDQSQTSSQQWLSPPDPSNNHIVLRLIHQEGTTARVMQGDTFREWMATGSLLWIHGKLGSGKSVLCSMIIENIKVMCAAGLVSLAYFYFDVRDTAKQNIRGLLTSLLFQLSARSDLCCEILSTLYHEHGNGSRQPGDDVLTQCLKDMLTIPEKGPMYIIVDAIDECSDISGPSSPRECILGLLDDLVQLKRPGLYICATSRLESDIETILRPLSSHSITLDDSTGTDIFDYVSAVMNTDQKMRRWTAEDQCLVIDTLSEKADGMLRWVSCQLDALRRSLPINIRRVLEQLPEQLNATYENALDRIDEENWEHAHRIFQCLTVASRPFRDEELCEFLMFDFSGCPGSIPKFVENRDKKP
ncbi:hypothetical protein EDB89DRAFT_604954 [Lactarius sanguifluus]|nr:hypothetical protein EDB89DRAFT_604954 [Lactarius sanguifluus]